MFDRRGTRGGGRRVSMSARDEGRPTLCSGGLFVREKMDEAGWGRKAGRQLERGGGRSTGVVVSALGCLDARELEIPSFA